MTTALCLDFDGTLAHRQGDFGAFLDGVRVDLGLLACDFDAFGPRLGAELGRDGVVTFRSALAATLAAFGQPVDDLGAVVDRALRSYTAPMALLPGAAELLDALAGTPLALVTNGPADMQRAAVDAVGITARFRAVIVSGDAHVGARKPAARPFALACEALGCSPDAALMVGDNLRCDVLGALACGMPALRIGGPGGEGYEGVPDLAALRAWLGSRLTPTPPRTRR